MTGPDEQFFSRGSIDVARDLLGMELVNSETGAGGRIVETEAYPGEKDPACHYDGRSTKRGRIFEKGPGTVYVYVIHGHFCMNFICGSEDYPEGVLIRALKPEKGIEKMAERRGRESRRELCSGPAKVCEALGIEREGFNGRSIRETSLELREGGDPGVGCTRRVGVQAAEDWPLRFTSEGSDFLSETLPPREPDLQEYRMP